MRPIRQRDLRRRRNKRRLWSLVIILAFGGLLATVLVVVVNKKDTGVKQAARPITAQTTNKQPIPAPPIIDLQPIVDGWVAKQPASYSIVIYDPAAKKVIGSSQPDRMLFAASLYKLFVAYLALEDIESGKQNPNGVLTGGNTRLQCIDRMIRESHSPCGEAMMADMGASTLEARLKAMGIAHTTFNGIQTTAADSAMILQYILEKRDLNEAHTAFLRDAMRKQEQRFRNGLAKGAPGAVVDSKVGWNETFNYHDIGIFTLPDGREFVVAILSQGNGSSKPIADFAATIYDRLRQ